MIATVLSQAEDLFVIRELRANLPQLSRLVRYAPENVVLVAQMDGEDHDDFVSRVLGRAHRALSQGRRMRAAVVSLETNAGPGTVKARSQLLRELAAILAQRSDGEIVITVSANVGAAERVGLFALVEATLQVAPKVNVRLAFAEREGKVARQQGRRVGSGQAAEF